MESLRTPESRHKRLDEHLVHVFSAKDFGAVLREESEYQKHRHTGVTLMKTSELRVVLETTASGVMLANHVVHGPATIFLVEGALEIETG